MNLELLRYSSQKNSTIGLLFDVTYTRNFLCFTLEDPYNKNKAYGNTRIPAGVYNLSLRQEGGVHEKYLSRYPDKHKGMIWIRGVSNFEFILIHCGNDPSDTEGCILVGDSIKNNICGDDYIMSSRSAYERIYPLISEEIKYSPDSKISIIDYDTPYNG